MTANGKEKTVATLYPSPGCTAAEPCGILRGIPGYFRNQQLFEAYLPMSSAKYDHAAIEKKWQDFWLANKTLMAEMKTAGRRMDSNGLLPSLPRFFSRPGAVGAGLAAATVAWEPVAGVRCECLTTLDDLIAAQTQRVEALKTCKKGLMQQIFPATEAVEA